MVLAPQVAVDNGVIPMELNVHVGNVALGFYTKLGFKQEIDLCGDAVLVLRRAWPTES